MPLEDMVPIEGDDQVHSGGMVYPTTHEVVPVGDAYYPWHQGRRADWKVENYAEYVNINDHWSLMARGARRIKVDLRTCLSNDRRYHDWKGYDDIEPSGHTKVFFNDRQVGLVRAYANDLLRHLLAVEQYISDIQNMGVFGWWSEADLNDVVGRQVDYDGYPGVVADIMDYIKNGEVMIYSPTWPDDGYDRGGRLRSPILYEKINWYPDPNRPRVEVPVPFWGGENA